MKPDFQNILNTLERNDRSRDYIPHYEHFVDDEVIEKIMGYNFTDVKAGTTTFADEYVKAEDLPAQIEYWKKKIQFYTEMGYDYLPVEFPPLFPQPKRISTRDTAVHNRGNREWINEHEGIIETLDDLNNADYWPDSDHIFNYILFESIAGIIPENIKIIGGFAGGPMEHGLYLLGFEKYFEVMLLDTELFNQLYEKLSAIFLNITERLIRIDQIGAFRIGDDLGFKASTLISPEKLRTYIFPIYKSIADLCHTAGKPFILHSCGNLEDIMPDLIDYCKIDAKHSFEDIIIPVDVAYKKWGDKVAILGGIDVDFLCRRTPDEIRDHTSRIMEACSGNGGFAIGSGNTITNYIPVENYLAMIKAADEFNGKQ